MAEIVKTKPTPHYEAQMDKDALLLTEEVGPQQLMVPNDPDPVGTRLTRMTDRIEKHDLARFKAGIKAQKDSIENQMAQMKAQIEALVAIGVPEFGAVIDSILLESKRVAPSDAAHKRLERKVFNQIKQSYQQYQNYQQLKFSLGQLEQNLERATEHLRLITDTLAKDGKKTL